MNDTLQHQPVLLQEVITSLQVKAEGFYVDATFGRGGHAKSILEYLGPRGKLMAMDKDPQAIAAAHSLFADDPRFAIVQDSFADLKSAIGQHGQIDGILFDLGVSSPQLDDPQRGFSFSRDGELDMRMDPGTGISARQWISEAKESELVQVFREFGEERYAKRIARAIVKVRQLTEIGTTQQLAEIIAKANPAWEKGKNPATRCFQAIRIFINNELDDLRKGLSQAVDVLTTGGRLVVISFHSLEDRIVKRFIRDEARGDRYPAGLPVTQQQLNPRLLRVGKAVRPTTREIEANPRARSAIMRIAEKLA